MKNLRKWQAECIGKVISSYEREQKKHFLCLATPAAGKTVLAASLSRQLIDRNQIDFVLCFSPSIEVAKTTEVTFRSIVGPFNGLLGSKGGSFTYQSLIFKSIDFWATISTSRVLVILDEIHHCSGTNELNANAWGLQVLRKIRAVATFTLELSGTPWRTDDLPITLARYREGKAQASFTYPLQQAIKDGVCRQPKVVLINCKQLTIEIENSAVETFESLEDLLKSKKMSYSRFVNQERAIQHLLKSACEQLEKTRVTNPNAGGLVVAENVEHARWIANMLKNQLSQSVQLVSYKEPDPQQVIDNFRKSKDQWIVSIGMISEGVDIPRLQVCCHLSTIKTELYYRQILGRILRTISGADELGWLFSFAEPTLVEYAENLKKDIPDARVVEMEVIDRVKLDYTENLGNQNISNDPDIPRITDINTCTDKIQLRELVSSEPESMPKTSASPQYQTLPKHEPLEIQLLRIKKFTEKVMSVFQPREAK